jgi:hypothetical protein
MVETFQESPCRMEELALERAALRRDIRMERR